MKSAKLYYREPRDASFQPRHVSNKHKGWGTLTEATKEQIVTLYTRGMTIDSIAREIRRARHLVVHILQSKGLLGNRRTGLGHEEAEIPSNASGEPKERGAAEERRLQLEPDVDKAVEVQLAMKIPARKMTRLQRPKAAEKSKITAIKEPRADQSATQMVPDLCRWSPQVVDALFKVVGQKLLDTEVSLDQVTRMVTASKRKTGR